jgi:glycerophosphoryl diester phosphodiesterase
MKFILIILSLISANMLKAQNTIDIQGHRGARGKMPENSIPAFIYALDQGVTTLELDVVITKDGQVVVSHEPFLSHEICYDSLNVEILESKEKTFNIYQMSYDQVSKCDCGSKGNPRFAEQTKIKTSKPLLSDVISEVEKHIKGTTHYEVQYNIEIKSDESGDDIFHPTPEVFSELVNVVITEYLPWRRIIIQSFDFRTLKYWHLKYPKVKLAALVENQKSIKSNLSNLGFNPNIYSPDYKLLTKNKVGELHNLGIQVVPWTVNDKSDMKKLVSWKVDGLITDFPDRAVELGYIRPLINN